MLNSNTKYHIFILLCCTNTLVLNLDPVSMEIGLKILQFSEFKLIQTLDSGYLDLNLKLATIIAALNRHNFHRKGFFHDQTNN